MKNTEIIHCQHHISYNEVILILYIFQELLTHLYHQNKEVLCLFFSLGLSGIVDAVAGFLLFTQEDHRLGHIRNVYSSCQRISCKFELTGNERRGGMRSTDTKVMSP